MSLGSFFRKHKRCCFDKLMYVRSMVYAQGKHSVHDIQITGEFKFAIPRLGTAQLKKRNTFSIHFYNAGAPSFGGLSPPSLPPQTLLMPQTHPPDTHTQTHRQERLQYTAPQLARSVKRIYESVRVAGVRRQFGLLPVSMK